MVLVVALIFGSFAFALAQNSDQGLGIESATAANVDYFLKIDGVEGESTDNRHKGEIEILSFSWGATNAGSTAGGGGGGAGKVSMQDFHFTKHYSKASPVLMQATASGKHFKTADLVLRKAGKDQQEFLKYKLSDVIITSYQTSGSGDVPMDSVSINFAKIEVEYKTQKPDGTLGDTTRAGWDLKANKPTAISPTPTPPPVILEEVQTIE